MWWDIFSGAPKHKDLGMLQDRCQRLASWGAYHWFLDVPSHLARCIPAHPTPASPSSPRNSRVQTSFRGCRPRFSMTNSLLCVWVVYCVPKSITSNLPWTGERTWTKTWQQTGKNRGKNIKVIINQKNPRPKSKSRCFFASLCQSRWRIFAKYIQIHSLQLLQLLHRDSIRKPGKPSVPFPCHPRTSPGYDSRHITGVPMPLALTVTATSLLSCTMTWDPGKRRGHGTNVWNGQPPMCVTQSEWVQYLSNGSNT